MIIKHDRDGIYRVEIVLGIASFNATQMTDLDHI